MIHRVSTLLWYQLVQLMIELDKIIFDPGGRHEHGAAESPHHLPLKESLPKRLRLQQCFRIRELQHQYFRLATLIQLDGPYVRPGDASTREKASSVIKTFRIDDDLRALIE